jgi:hypothetical protein
MNATQLHDLAQTLINGGISEVDFLNAVQIDDMTVRGYLQAAGKLPDAVKRCLNLDVLLTASPEYGMRPQTEVEKVYFGLLRTFIESEMDNNWDDDDDEDDGPIKTKKGRPTWFSPVIENAPRSGFGFRFIFKDDFWRLGFLNAIRDNVPMKFLTEVVTGTVENGWYVRVPLHILNRTHIKMCPPSEAVSNSKTPVLTSNTAREVTREGRVPKVKTAAKEPSAVVEPPYHRRLFTFIDESEIVANISPDVNRASWTAPSVRLRNDELSGVAIRWVFTFKSKDWRDAFIASLKRESIKRNLKAAHSMGTTFGRFYVTVPAALLKELSIVPTKNEVGEK